jgi:hypothetical protein
MDENIMANDQIRSLASLDNVISSSRVLNLNKIYKMQRNSAEYTSKPLFSNNLLNRSILLKHRLRENERNQFADGRSVATKILFPIETMELKLGAQYLFVGQRDFEDRLCEILREKSFDLGGDVVTLQLLDSIPSLDSYLLREFLERGGIRPADCYLENGIADRKPIQQFILNEISALAQMSFGLDEYGAKAPALIEELLSPKAAEVTDELRQTLQMEKPAYRQGLFFWKAILFYKWQIQKIIPVAEKVFREIRRIKPVGLVGKSDRLMIESLRNKIAYKFSLIFSEAHEILSIYNQSYEELINTGNVMGFKEFLISSSQIFTQLGESYNDVSHIVNFWRYRPKKGHSVAVTLEVLASMLEELDSMSYIKATDRNRA